MSSLLVPQKPWRDATGQTANIMSLTPGTKRVFALTALEKIKPHRIWDSGVGTVDAKITLQALASFELTDKGIGETRVQLFRRNGLELTNPVELVSPTPNIRNLRLFAGNKLDPREVKLPIQLQSSFQSALEEISSFEGQAIENHKPLEDAKALSKARLVAFTDVQEVFNNQVNNLYDKLEGLSEGMEINRSQEIAVHRRMG